MHNFEEASQIAHKRVKDPKRGLRENCTEIQTELPGLLWTIDITQCPYCSR